jgi:hypothetical protein
MTSVFKLFAVGPACAVLAGPLSSVTGGPLTSVLDTPDLMNLIFTQYEYTDPIGKSLIKIAQKSH